MLASPHYGEKWGRHWLDLVRFAETNSYERDGAKPNAWRYRDYVIRSFNEDKPYDRFVREQIAGDEMPEAKTSSDPVIATGYYRLGIWDDEPTDPLQSRYDVPDLLRKEGSRVLGEERYKQYLGLKRRLHQLSFPKDTPTALAVSEAGPNVPDTFVLLRGSAHAQGAKVEPGFPEVLSATTPTIPAPPPGAKTSGRRTVLAQWLTSP